MWNFISYVRVLQIFMWNFKDNKDLVGVAFIDTAIYSHRAVSLKNFIVIGDIHHSIQLLQYKVIHQSVHCYTIYLVFGICG